MSVLDSLTVAAIASATPAESSATPPSDQVEERSGFQIITRAGAFSVIPTDPALVRYLRLSCPRTESDEYPLDTLIEARVALLNLQSRHEDPDLDELIEWMDRAIVLVDPKRMQRIASGTVTFSEIGFAFKKGDEVFVEGSPAFGGRILRIDYDRSFFGSSWRISLEVITGMLAGGPAKVSRQVQIPEFEGFLQIGALPVHPLTPEERERLTARGRVFREHVYGSTYASYQGHIYRPGWFGTMSFRADGRVMVDASSMHRFDNGMARGLLSGLSTLDGNYLDDSQGKKDFRIDDAELWMCQPSLPAFSFATKIWGEVHVEGLSAIRFREDAFEKLVLDAELKNLVLALVKNAGGSFTDLIDAKSGGCIMLLHGPPGAGKTLTAEATAEALHRPLYAISVGELGTHPSELEESLRNILDMAQRWNAVILLDEADIFLEARDERDIVRNAMVGVFLRLLEYHDGVMFLTTNRVRNFDPAFHSRISIAVSYSGMDADKREKVWSNLLAAADITGIDPKAYSHVDINGRQIKNALRLALALARDEGVTLSQKHIEATIRHTEQFQQELARQ